MLAASRVEREPPLLLKHAATNGRKHLPQRLLIVGIVGINVVSDVVEVRIEIGMKPPSWQPTMVWSHRSKPILA